MGVKKGAVWPALLLACLLAGCGAEAPVSTPAVTPAPPPSSVPTPAPTPEPTAMDELPEYDTHDAFHVDTGGALGELLVTVERENGEDYEFELRFSVWDPVQMDAPIQTMTAQSGVFHWYETADANFDGYLDFGYMYAMGNQPQYWHYWLWDEAEKQFAAAPVLDEISCPEFDAETETISGWARSSCCSGVQSYWRWEEGELVCIRRVELHYPERNEDGTFNQLATVEDRIDGALTEVFREYAKNAADNGTYPFEEVWAWKNDPDYHGEP